MPCCMAWATLGCTTARPILAKPLSLLKRGVRFILVTLVRMVTKINLCPHLASMPSTSSVLYGLKPWPWTCC
eukprot:1122900-Pyramimonas_sp.AAC.1